MTNSEQHDLEKLLKDNLSDRTAPVPGFVWDRIEDELFPKKKRRGLLWIFFTGFLLLGGLAAAYFNSGAPDHAEASLAKHEQKTAGESGNGQTSSHKALHGSQSDDNAFASAGMTEGQLPGRKKIFPVVSSSGAGKSTQMRGKAPGGKSGSSASGTGNDLSTPGKGTKAMASGSEAGSAEAKDPGMEKTAAALPEQETTKSDSTVATEQSQGRDTVAAPETAEQENGIHPKAPRKRFMLSLYGGASLYDMAVFKDYFVSGQLSNRPFRSSGFELGTGFAFNLTRRLNVYAQVSFNRKETSFDYALAITESDYFHHLVHGELLPIGNIIDNGVGNCFLAEGVKASYRTDSWLVSLGASYKIIQWKKLDLGADVRFSVNASSGLQLNELTIIQVAPYGKEHFNFYKVGAGLSINYRISERFVAGITPMFHWQLTGDNQSFYKGVGKELVLPVRLGFCF